MSSAPHHPPGTFCWPELATTNLEGSLGFYTQLFGWAVHDSLRQARNYVVLKLGHRNAAACYELPVETSTGRVPPHWDLYVSVENADETARRAPQAGGRVLLGPFDVLDAGRMATVADPGGATFSIWQAIRHPGAGVLGESGALGWSQLNARDAAAAKRFYAAMFGWSWRDDPMGPEATYTTWLRGDAPVGGMMVMPPGVPAEAPAHWLVYFGAADVGETHARALSLGARSMVAPADVPGGPSFAVLADPQGAIFGLVSAV